MDVVDPAAYHLTMFGWHSPRRIDTSRIVWAGTPDSTSLSNDFITLSVTISLERRLRALNTTE